VDEQTIEDRERESRDEEVFEIWRENLRALQVFLRCARSWDIVTGPQSAYYQGIRPESMESVMRMSGIPRAGREALLDDLQVMEADAQSILNEKRND